MIGYTPREVDECTLWEFTAAVEGYREAHKTGEEAPPPMADEDLANLGVAGF